jgi:DNA-binding transcriptional regulator YiaG
MSGFEMRSTFGPTSAGRPMPVRQARMPMRVGPMLAELGTSSAPALPEVAAGQARRAAQTTAGAAISAGAPPGAAIAELRRLSGLTWDQLARVFHVSRRALHFWASGKPMAPSNEEHLHRLVSVLRKIDRGSASANRAALLDARADGSLPFDLLATGDYERVLALLGPGDARRRTPPKLSDAAKAARAPRPPEDLIGALQDRAHRDGGPTRAAKSVKVRSGR